MNDTESKAPIYIVIFVAILIAAAGGYYFVFGIPSNKNLKNETPVPTPEITPESTPVSTTPQTTAPPVSAPPKKVETIKCEICHTDPQDLTPHVNGGKLCINCHGSQVHNIHIGPGTVGLSCETCHGFPPKIPKVEKGEGPGHYSVCEKCHAAPPDSLKPSYGNLIVVHLSRGKYCTNCHGTDIAGIHAKALGKKK